MMGILHKERGCGLRRVGSLYACVETSPFGMGLEHFLIDPPIPWQGPKVLRSPMVVTDKSGYRHIIMTVGARYYPFIPDFVEEARRMGVSKQIPRTFDFSILTPYKSTLILLHPRVIPLFGFNVEAECKKPCCTFKSCKPNHAPFDLRKCIFALWPLSQFRSYKRTHEVEKLEGGGARIRTPSCTYGVGRVHEINGDGMTYSPGIFAKFYITHFEYIGKSVPTAIVKRARKVKWKVKACRE